jgi:two-component system KDP operon response regulator KdpE
MSGRVLVVDDEVEMQRALRTGLRYHDFEVHAVGSGEEAVREAAAWRPDVILLDLGLPGMDGFETLQALRPASRAAVIVVSVMPGEKDKVRALDLGADDYLVKPFGTEELVARIRAVLRRQADVSAGEPVVHSGDLEIDLGRRSVTIKGRAVRLTPTEYELLRYLALHAGKPVTHNTLLSEVWGASAIGDTYNTRYIVAQIREEARRRPGQPSIHRQRARGRLPPRSVVPTTSPSPRPSPLEGRGLPAMSPGGSG